MSAYFDKLRAMLLKLRTGDPSKEEGFRAYIQNAEIAALAGGEPATISAATGNKIALIGNSITQQCQPVITGESYTTAWNAGGAVTVGQTTRPSSIDLTAGLSLIKYQALNSGVMASNEPIWPLTVGETVADGTVIWKAIATTSKSANWGFSWWYLAQALAGQPLDEIYIVGQGGQQSPAILETLSRVMDSSPDIVFFANIFENDTVAGLPTATLSSRFDAYVAAVDSARAAGKKVIVQTLFPSGSIDGSAAFTGYSRGTGSRAWTWLNQKIRELAKARKDVILFEPDLLYLDAAQVTGAPWPENTSTYLSKFGSGQRLKKTDGVHPNLAAHWIVALALTPVLRANFPAASRFGLPLDETNKTPNPLKGGTGGTAGLAVTGTIASGLTLNNYYVTGSGTGTASIVPRTDIAGNWQRLVYNNGGSSNAGDGNIAMNGIALAPYVADDLIQAFTEFRILANPTLLQQCLTTLRFAGAGNGFDCTYAGYDGYYSDESVGQDLGQFLTADTTFIFKSVPIRIPAGTTSLEMYNSVRARGAAVFTVDFGRESIRKLATGKLT